MFLFVILYLPVTPLTTISLSPKTDTLSIPLNLQSSRQKIKAMNSAWLFVFVPRLTEF